MKNVINIVKYIAIVALLMQLCGCQSYLYSLKVCNLNKYDIKIEPQTFNVQKKYRLFGIKHWPLTSASVFPYFELPDKIVKVTWHNANTEENFSQELHFDVPEKFTRNNGDTIYLCFYEDKVFICYGLIEWPPPDPNYRYSGKQEFIWDTGWSFDPDDYIAYCKKNKYISPEEYEKKWKKQEPAR